MSFSGGKDSTVLLHIARQMYPDIPAVFSNTGLEYPEIQRFVKSFDNVDIVTPSMNFGEVISTYGYPLIGKEVAEAIYYARRIRPPERERERGLEEAQRTPRSTAERKQGELLGYRANGRSWNWWGGQKHLETERRRANLLRTLPQVSERERRYGAGVVGKPTNHGRETDGFYRGSEVPPG